MRKILHTVDIDAARDDVYRALTTQEGLAGWWTTDVSAEEGLGGTIAFRFAEEFRPDMKVTALEENSRVEWTCVEGEPLWRDNIFRFVLHDRGARTMLIFTQEYATEISDAEYGRFNFNWGYYLRSLKQLCETGAGFPFRAG